MKEKLINHLSEMWYNEAPIKEVCDEIEMFDFNYNNLEQQNKQLQEKLEKIKKMCLCRTIFNGTERNDILQIIESENE